MSKFYKLLDESRGHKVTTTETRERKIRVINNFVNSMAIVLIFTKKTTIKAL